MRHLVTALSVAIAASALTSAQAQEVVTIGHSAPLTGPQAANGKDNENGARLAVDELNKAGIKVAGKTVTFKLVSDDDPTRSRRAGCAEPRRQGRRRGARRTTRASRFPPRACTRAPACRCCRSRRTRH